jgi:hypothetical protein
MPPRAQQKRQIAANKAVRQVTITSATTNTTTKIAANVAKSVYRVAILTF